MARPLSFNPEEKLELAMNCFWHSGYAETSISQLTEAMGINKFSMYKQYGDKEALFNQALKRYDLEVYQALLTPLAERNGKKSILAYLDRFDHYISSDLGRNGCFLNNTLLAGPSLPEESRTLAVEMATKLRLLLKANFEIARKNGELTASPMECVNFTSMTIQALLNTRKTLGAKAMSQNLKFFVAIVSHW